MKHTLDYKSGYTLCYTDFGSLDGFPIIVQHGMIASISNENLFERLINAGRRLICVARPGYGGSSPYPMEKIADWGEIISGLVERLGLSHFDILGMSSGAPYGYAIGHKLPEKVRRIYIFSGTPALYAENVLAHWPYPVQKNATIAEMQQMAKEVFFSNLSKDDLAREDIRDSMANECFGVALDLQIRCRPWGFTLAEITADVSMQHSRSDADVPFAAAELTARMLPHCRLEEREGPHFSPEMLDLFFKQTVLS